MLQLLTRKVFEIDKHVLDISREYANLNQNDISHLESFDLKEIVFSITKSILIGKEGARCSSF
jgi:hypothetical protein